MYKRTESRRKGLQKPQVGPGLNVGWGGRRPGPYLQDRRRRKGALDDAKCNANARTEAVYIHLHVESDVMGAPPLTANSTVFSKAAMPEHRVWLRGGRRLHRRPPAFGYYE